MGMSRYTYLRVQTDCAVDGRQEQQQQVWLDDELSFRKAIQYAMVQSFGLSAAGTYVDMLRFRSGVTVINSINQSTKAGSSISSLGAVGRGSNALSEHVRGHAPAVHSSAKGKREVEDAVIRVARE